VRPSQPAALRRLTHQRQFQSARLDDDQFALDQPAARLTHQFPQPVGHFAQEQAFPLAAGAGAPTDQACRDDAGVIEDEQIARRQQVGQVGKDVMRDGAVGAADQHEARTVALGAGLLRDQVLGQVVVEGIGAHREIV